MLLQTIEQRTWLKQLHGAVIFLEELKRTEVLHGRKWKEGMRTYYKDRAVALLDAAPPGVEKLKKAYAQRLAKV